MMTGLGTVRGLGAGEVGARGDRSPSRGNRIGFYGKERAYYCRVISGRG